MYDAVIGRFVIVDPARQFYSPFLGMGNNPFNIIDPDGGTGGPAQKKPKTSISQGALNEMGAILEGVDVTDAMVLDGVVISGDYINSANNGVNMLDYMPGGKHFWSTNMGQDLSFVRRFLNPTHGLDYYNTGELHGSPFLARDGLATGHLNDITKGLQGFGLKFPAKNSHWASQAKDGLERAGDIYTAISLVLEIYGDVKDLHQIPDTVIHDNGRGYTLRYLYGTDTSFNTVDSTKTPRRNGAFFPDDAIPMNK